MPYYDTIIAGGGPAGLTAGTFSARQGLKTLLVEKMIPGGQPALAQCVENYPGLKDVDGWELSRHFYREAREQGVEIHEEEEVLGIEGKRGVKEVQTSNQTYQGRAVIVATGGRPRKLGVRGEKTFLRRGVHYCAQCAGHSYRGRKVAVIGGGNPALCSAYFLSGIASKVFLVQDGFKPRGEEVMRERLRGMGNLEEIFNEVLEIRGRDRVSALRLAGGRELELEGVFVYTGTTPNSEVVKVEKDERCYIEVDAGMRTSEEGIFACGGVVREESRIISSAGEGATAALSAAEYLG